MKNRLLLLSLLLAASVSGQCHHEDLFVDFTDGEPILLSEDQLCTPKGRFTIHSEVAAVNEYAYNVSFDGVSIGRYFLDDDLTYQAAILDVGPELQNRLGLAPLRVLHGVPRDRLCHDLQQAVTAHTLPSSSLIRLGALLEGWDYQEVASDVWALALAHDATIECEGYRVAESPTGFRLYLEEQVLDIGKEVLEVPGFTMRLEFRCFEYGTDLVVTQQDGNNYQVTHLFLERVDQEFVVTFQYRIWSTRAGSEMGGMKIAAIPLRRFFEPQMQTRLFNASDVTIGNPEAEDEAKTFFSTVMSAYKNKKYDTLAVLSHPFVFANLPLFEKKNVTQLNNLGFYCQKLHLNENAIYILENVILLDPNRTVAYLNLADSYWDLSDTAKAKELYGKYVALMRACGKQKRIPGYVNVRLK